MTSCGCLQAICSLAMLTYIHVAFSHLPNHCLDSVKEDWPRDGILRVEIIRDPGTCVAGSRVMSRLHQEPGSVTTSHCTGVVLTLIHDVTSAVDGYTYPVLGWEMWFSMLQTHFLRRVDGVDIGVHRLPDIDIMTSLLVRAGSVSLPRVIRRVSFGPGISIIRCVRIGRSLAG